MSRDRIVDDYEKIYKWYGLPRTNTIESRIADIFHETFPNTTWKELSPMEQDIFMYITLQSYIFKKHIKNPTKRNKILKKTTQYFDKQFKKEKKEAEELQKQFDENREKPFQVFYDQELFDSIKDEEEKENVMYEAYLNFVDALKHYDSAFPVPNFDEWKEHRYKNVMGYIAHYFSPHDTKNEEKENHTVKEILDIDETQNIDKKETDECQNTDTEKTSDSDTDETQHIDIYSKEYFPCILKFFSDINKDKEDEDAISQRLQPFIDHTILMTIVKVLKQNSIAHIDVDKITSCYQSMDMLSNVIGSDPPLFEYKPLLGVSQHIQDNYIDTFWKLNFQENKKLQNKYIKMFENFTDDVNNKLQEEYIHAFENLLSNPNQETKTQYINALENLHFEINKEAQQTYIQKFKILRVGTEKGTQRYIDAFLKLISNSTEINFKKDRENECVTAFYNLHFENHPPLKKRYIKWFKDLRFGIPMKQQEEYIQLFKMLFSSNNDKEIEQKYLKAIKQLNLEIIFETEQFKEQYINAFKELDFKISKEIMDKYIEAFNALIYSGVSPIFQEKYIKANEEYATYEQQIKDLDFLKPL